MPTKKLFFIFIFFYSSLGQAKVEHFVFLVHGLAGGKRTFGNLPKALDYNLNYPNTHRTYVTEALEYSTGSDDADIEDFTSEIQQQIENFHRRYKISPGEAKISFVGHSQGGLIILNWLKRAMVESPQFFKAVESVTTLSTPYWGSAVAYFAYRARAYYLGDFFGKKELQTMAHAGEKTFQLAEFLRRPSFERDKIFNRIRFLSIGASIASPLAVDFAVNLPSSQMNFIFQQNNLVSRQYFAPHLSVHAAHFWFPLLRLAGVAKIYKECVELINCKHPTFKAILYQVLGIPIEEKGPPTEQFVALGEVKNWGGKNVEILVVPSRHYSIRSAQIQKISSNDEITRFFVVGQIERFGNEDLQIQLKNDEETKDLKVHIEKGLTTVAEWGQNF